MQRNFISRFSNSFSSLRTVLGTHIPHLYKTHKLSAYTATSILSLGIIGGALHFLTQPHTEVSTAPPDKPIVNVEDDKEEYGSILTSEILDREIDKIKRLKNSNLSTMNKSKQFHRNGPVGKDIPLPPPTYTQPARQYSSYNSAKATTSSWNMDALFQYPNALKQGLKKLLNMSTDTAFDKAVIVESGGRQFDDAGNVIRSHKDATGKAQVLPSTARLIAPRCTGAVLDESRFLYDSGYNESLGRCYYREQYQTYGNNVLAALAYNTGPGNLNRHIDRVGDPTRGEIDLVDFIRTIPSTENRHYTLHMMKKGGLIDRSSFGTDVHATDITLSPSFHRSSTGISRGRYKTPRLNQSFANSSTSGGTQVLLGNSSNAQALYGNSGQTRYLSAN